VAGILSRRCVAQGFLVRRTYRVVHVVANASKVDLLGWWREYVNGPVGLNRGLLSSVLAIPVEFPRGAAVIAEYHGRRYAIDTVPPGGGFSFDAFSLTEAGEELAPIAGSNPNERYREMTLRSWRDRGLEVGPLGVGPDPARGR